MNNLNYFFSPKSIAIVGASPKKRKLGNILIENIRCGGWRGKMYFVNPKYAKSRKDYFSSLDEIKKPVDLVLIAIPASFANRVIENGTKARPAMKNFVVISSGFKEIGTEGRILEKNLGKIAKKYNLNILGPNCLGFTNPREKLNATFTNVKLQEGNIAIISQSGALAVALLDWAANKKIGFSKIISIGNKAVIDESQIINFLAKDKNTKAIALYLEDIQNGPEFMRAVANTSVRKPVIILKAGKNAVGQKAVSSHTGSLAQDEEIIEAVFEKYNIIPADNIEEFQDMLYYLDLNPIPAKNGVIIVTNAGGPGVIASDFFEKSKNINLFSFSNEFKNELKKNLPLSASVENPIDVIGDAPPERYRKTLEKIAKKYPSNPVIVILTPQNQTDPEKVAEILAKSKHKISSLSACFMGGEKVEHAKAILKKNNIPDFENPGRALAVVDKLAKYFELKTRRDAPVERLRIVQKTPQRGASTARFNPAFQNAFRENRKMLFWNESEKLFKNYGIKLTQSISFEILSELKNKKIKFPCALKTDDPNIAHRLEKNAVILNIQNKKELKRAFENIRKKIGAKHFLVQTMADPGLELIVGMKRDSSFGPIVLAGWGGSFTEIFKDKIILIPPLSQNEVMRGLSRLAIFPILKGFRGKKGYNLREISKIVMAVIQIAAENPQILEIDINPLTAYNNGKGGQILDVKIFLQHSMLGRIPNIEC